MIPARGARWRLLRVACVCGVMAAACTPPRPSLLLVTFDTTRADHLGAWGHVNARTPRLDALAAQGIRYARAYTTAPLTLPAHASLMTGLYPFEHGVRDNGRFRLADEAETLAEILQREGYRTGAVVGAFVLDPRFGLDQGFDDYDADLGEQRSAGRFGFTERTAPAVTDAALAWLGAAGEPFFLWVHYFDPHASYAAHADDPELSGLLPYDAEIAFTDRELGRLLDHLEANGRDADTLVVVASDHGEGLWEHGEISHGAFVYESTVRVALVVRPAGGARTGLVVDQPVSLVDVLPTVLRRLDIAHGAVSGRVLPDEDEQPTSPRAVYFENHAVAWAFGLHPQRGIALDSDKWIEAGRPERYDLESDPHETRNLFAPGDPESARLRAELEALVADAEASHRRLASVAVELDGDAARRLAALGYLPGPAAGVAPAPDAPGLEPRQAAADVREVLIAQGMLGSGQERLAAERLAAVVEAAPRVNRRALLLLGELAVGEAGRDVAVAALRPYLDRKLDAALRFVVAAKLGIALGRSGHYAEAVEAYEIAAALEPDDPNVMTGLAAARRLLAATGSDPSDGS